MGLLTQLGTSDRHHAWDVSAADPGKLLDYSAVGAVMCEELATRRREVFVALDALAVCSDPHELLPSVGDVADRLTDLAGDWAHLDEFVNDVGAGFARFLDPDWDGDRDDVRGGVIVAPDSVLATRGQIGIADRDDAMNAAQADAATVHDLLADGASVEEVEALIARVRRGQYDPEYAVTLVELLGPEAYVDIVGMVEDAYGDSLDAGDPAEAGWGLGQLAPFGTALTTAVDTRRGVAADQRLDPYNVTLRPDRRLDREWLDELTDIGTSDDPHSRFDVSLLASQATLPEHTILALAGAADVAGLIRSSDGPMQMVPDGKGNVWGPSALTTEANILRGLANNPGAAETWQTEADDDVTNAEALLRYEIDGSTDVSERNIEALGAAASETWSSGLTVGDAQLFDVVVETVADEGELHLPGMEPGLAAGTVAHMDDLHTRINDGFTPRDDPTSELEGSGVFLREVMRDEDAARAMSDGAGAYLEDRLTTLDTTGADAPPEGRGTYLEETGRTVGAITQSHANALLADGRTADEVNANNADQANFLLGLLPKGVGDLNALADALGSGGGDVIFGDGAYESAKPQAQTVIRELDDTLAVTIALHHHDVGTIDAASAEAAALDPNSKTLVRDDFEKLRVGAADGVDMLVYSDG